MSTKATKAVSQKIRAWHLSRRSDTDLSDLAREINPQVRGWIGYYGAFYRFRLYLIALRIDQHLVRWAMQKYKRLRGRPERAWAWLEAVRQRQQRSRRTVAFRPLMLTCRSAATTSSAAVSGTSTSEKRSAIPSPGSAEPDRPAASTPPGQARARPSATGPGDAAGAIPAGADIFSL